MRRAATLVACLLASACAKTNPYKCSASTQCVLAGKVGVCEPEGFCAFPDPGCPSGTRFESGAGDGLGGQCTTPPDAPVPPCGALGQACCSGSEQGSGTPCVAGTYCNAGMCDECVADLNFGHDIGCFLKKDHSLWCAGNQSNGELGNGAGSNIDVPTPMPVVDSMGPLTDVSAFGTGYVFGCAVRTGGVVQCWGRNYSGMLGNNSTADSNKAVQVLKANGSGTAPLTGMTDVKASGQTACALDGTTGTVYCWGYNGDGELGNGSNADRHIAGPVMAGSAAFTGAEQLISADGFYCAKKAGEFWCWGDNSSGELGTGSNDDKTNPVKVATASAFGVGSYHSCWVNTDTTVSCVGANWHAQLGQGSGNDYTGQNKNIPAPVVTDAGTPFTGAAEVTGGGAMTCARTTDGHLYCWGDNKYGQIGGAGPTPTPTLVLDDSGMPLEHVDHIVAKWAHICAHTTDAGWKCWGRGRDGELGDGKARSRGLATPLGVSCP